MQFFKFFILARNNIEVQGSIQIKMHLKANPA